MSEATTGPTAVVIDDDGDVRDLLVQVLSSAGFTVHAFDNGYDGVDAVIAHDPDITTLDINMPGIDGFETARRIREHSSTYILLITALTEEADAILGFSVGADDVVTKPFRARELRARVLAAQRRRPRDEVPAVPGDVPTAARALVGNAGLVVNRSTHSVTVDGHPILLTRTEFELLATLLEAAPEVRSKVDLVSALHPDHTTNGHVSDADERAIETHMTNLRRKLGDSAVEPRFIQTLRAVGYRALVPDDASEHPRSVPNRIGRPTFSLGEK
jgi:two-component system OmpR family response regulator